MSLLDATVPSDEVSSKSDCENRTGKNQTWFESRFEIRHAGSWLGRSPFQKSDIKTVENWMQVRPGDQPGYPKDTIESFVGHSSMGLLCPLLKLKMKFVEQNQKRKPKTTNPVRSFTSLQMFHTHTTEQNNWSVSVLMRALSQRS